VQPQVCRNRTARSIYLNSSEGIVMTNCNKMLLAVLLAGATALPLTSALAWWVPPAVEHISDQ
jgi:hypothetical protein